MSLHARRLPTGLRLLVAANVVVVLLCCFIGLVVANTFMPAYSTPRQVAASYAWDLAVFGLIPGVPTAALVWSGRWLYLRGHLRSGAALIVAPLVVLPALWSQFR